MMFRDETEFVHWLRIRTYRRARGMRLGIGDDAALARLSPGQELILKADLSIEGIHFTRRLHPPGAVGHRALARPLSDIAAMGGTPRFALVSLALARRTSRAWVEQFYTGLVALGRRFGVAVVGGDTAVVASCTLIDVMVAGEVPRGRALVRSAARPGDQLFLSGRLGLAALGLRLLRSRPDLRRLAPVAPQRVSVAGVASQALHAHLYPEPRCALGRFLAERRLASALIDLSDGLSTDLGHLCRASGVGARIWADRIPGASIPESGGRGKSTVRALSPADALELALHGGEDYELLFTVPPRLGAQVPRSFRGLPLRRIGEIRRSKQILLVKPTGATRPLEPAGYDHFKGS